MTAMTGAERVLTALRVEQPDRVPFWEGPSRRIRQELLPGASYEEVVAHFDLDAVGVDVSPEGFCQAVRDNDYDVIGLSALLTTTMPFQAETIEALKAAGLRDKVKVAIGGAVCTQQFADRIGADCYAADANDAVRKLAALVGGPRKDR